MQQEYHIKPKVTEYKAKERYRGVSYRRPIDAAKELVPTIDLADRLVGAGGLRRRGGEWVGRCPLPDHQDKTPSFAVYTQTNSWFCFGCVRGGDVIELARLAWGYDQRDAHIAAAELLMEFGHEVPERPPAWSRNQERQKKMRHAVDETTKNILRRRLFKRLILPHVNAIADEEERNQELRRAWSDFRRLMP